MGRHSKIKPKRSLTSRKRSKDVESSREGGEFAQGLPEPLREEVEEYMPRGLRDLLRRSGSLNPQKAAVVMEQRVQKRKEREAAAEAKANAPPPPKRKREMGVLVAGQQQGSGARALQGDAQQSADGQRPGKRQRNELVSGSGGTRAGLAAAPLPANTKRQKQAAQAAQAGGARKQATAFKSGSAAKFGETNDAPPVLAFSQKLLKKAKEHASTAAQAAAQAAAAEREAAIAEERARVIANYKASRAGPKQMHKVPEFVTRVY
ncbi:hypothetical protein T492DRAFT_986606 [Pavlovales sp. CCMP2436]|nr:hypothetical protein T492DRAFT_986606 [Pavlovales sp. CCMP2436]|mmetsp:Transcript_12927/g.32781  ORF Transcript_12927/g.32781 Transcript_12927/m.32781 type:complete len:263 (+) Transcript_12927:79-867(+)